MKRTINTIILLCAAVTMLAQNSFIVADKNGNSQLVQSLIFQRDAANDQFSWKTDADANGYQKDRDIKDLLFIARTNNTLSTGATDEVIQVLEKLSGTDNADATVVATSLLSNPNVKEAYSMNNDHVIVKMKDDNSYISCPFYNLESVFSEGDDLELINNQANNIRQKEPKKAGEYNGKIALFNFFEGGPYHSQIRYTDLITSIFENNYYKVENYGQGYDNNGIPTFTISNLESVISRSSEYKAIIIMSHGYKTKDGVPYFATCEKFISGHEYPTDQTVLIDNNRFVAFPSIFEVDPNCLLYMGPCYGVSDEGDSVYPKTSIIGWKGKNAIAQIHAAIIFHKLFFSNGLVSLGKAIDSSFDKDPFNPSSLFYKSPNVLNLTNLDYKYNESLQREYAKDLSLTLEDYSTKDNNYGINRMPKDKFVKKTDKETVLTINGYIKGDLSDYSTVVKVSLEPVVRLQRDGEYQLTYKNVQGARLSDNVADFEYSSCFKDIKIPLDNNTLEGIYTIDVYIHKKNKWRPISQPYPIYVVYSSKLADNYVLPEYSKEELFKPTLLDSDGQTTEDITLPAGSTKTFTISGFREHTFRAASLDSNIANVSVDGNSLSVLGVSEGHTFIGVLDEQNQQMTIAEVTVTAGSATPEPYAILSSDGNTVTFYYDSQKNVRGGVNINSSFTDNPYGSATTAVFDTSFAGYRPSNTSLWFSNCTSLTSIIGLENFNTEDVRDMYAMFNQCEKLTALDISSLKTDKVESMDNMFWYCSSLKTINLSGWKTDNLTNMRYMFTGCSSLTDIDFSSFNTSKVTNMDYMFRYCSSLISLDLSNFKTGNVTDMSYMFDCCFNLKTIYVSEDNWDTSNVEYSSEMFGSCGEIEGENGTKWDYDHIDKEYARIDKDGSPGYLTSKNDHSGSSSELLFCPDDHHPHMIDLGLPSGTKWACCNVGAQKPEDYGGYYAWGETVVKDDYCKDTHAFYNNGFIDIGSNISGTQYDVASVLWGNSWCMPSNKQFEELNSNCSSEYVKVGEVFGCVFKSKNNEAKVFLPAGGLFYYDRCYYQETEGSYWTSELEGDGYSFRFSFTNEGFWGVEDAYRDRGLSVRPVVSSR